MRRLRTLVELLERDIHRDLGDAPTVDVQAAIAAQDLCYELTWADEALTPAVPSYVEGWSITGRAEVTR